MSYKFLPSFGYRMPTHFGPALGPRQKPGGGAHELDKGRRSSSIWVSHAANRDQIAALLPEGFEPGEAADLTVELKNMTNIGWLAGRGYSVISVSTGVRRLQGGKPMDGRFKLVLWENMADPIITGRDELGYPKVFADISDLDLKGDRAHATASWDKFTFLDIRVRQLSTETKCQMPSGPSYHQNYLPRIGATGEHALVQTILTSPGQGALQTVESLGGQGRVTFHRATWDQLPTLAHIVNGLADLKLGSCTGAGYVRTKGATDLRGQVIIAEEA